MDTLLHVNNVSKSFWGIKALDCVQLEVKRGEYPVWSRVFSALLQ